MKDITAKLVLITLLGLLPIKCEKEDIKLKYIKGYIVGFDPCTINHHYRIGYVIISTDLKDTLVSYNLSDDTFKMPASVSLNSPDTLYKIPESHFQNYRNSPFFSDSLRFKYVINISYSIAKEDVMIFYLCTTDILFLDFNIILPKNRTTG